VLAIRGQVIPATLNKVVLSAEYKDGSRADGEALIPQRCSPIKSVSLKPADIAATPEAIKAISEAEIIVLGPGSLYTSIIPNLLIKEINAAISSSCAVKVYICNIMTQHGETDGYTASDHLNAVISHSRSRIVDHCIVNTDNIPEDLAVKYKGEFASLIINDSDKIRAAGFGVSEEGLLEAGEVVRHDADKLARIIVSLLRDKYA
ncbi:MAG: uridine diphosphate-N-acetylglucosamine-binding protein YvcK, partial [Candidatus Omnitrophota bacterium]